MSNDKLGSESIEWMIFANCGDQEPSTFFPKDGAGVDIAKRICMGCVVREDCLEYAIVTKQDYGVWGGTSERERRKISAKLAAKILKNTGR